MPLTHIECFICWISRSQWPRGLRSRSVATCLLRSWVRIPPGAWMFVCYECCVLSGRGLCDEVITRPEESYRLWCVVVCDLETSWMRRTWPAVGSQRHSTQKKIVELTTWSKQIECPVALDIASFTAVLNTLNAELNLTCYLLALLGVHHFLHVSRIRVKSLTLRLLMSYIYGAPILDVSRSHTTTQHSR